MSFDETEDTGVCIKEIQEALLDGRVDLAIHSLKDLPTKEPDGLEIIVVPERAPAADILIARRGLIHPTHARPLGLPDGTVLGTFSTCRAAQALAWQPGLHIKGVEGEIPTLLEKHRAGEYDAILLGAAGVQCLELDMDDLDVLELRPEIMLPAPGQGALAIEVRRGDPMTAELTGLDDPVVTRLVQAERRLQDLIGDDRHALLGCLAMADDDGAIRLQAVLGDVDEAVTRAVVIRVAAVAQDPETVAQTCRLALLAPFWTTPSA